MGIAETYVLTDGDIEQLMAPISVTATGNTAAKQIDVAKGDAAAIVDVGAITGAPTSVTAQLQSSLDGSTNWTNVGAAVTLTANAVFPIRFNPQDQVGTYYRLANTVTGGTTPTILMGASIVYWPAKN